MMLHMNKSGRSKEPSRNWRRALIMFPTMGWYEPETSRSVYRVFLAPGIYNTRVSGYHNCRLVKDAKLSMGEKIGYGVLAFATFCLIVAAVVLVSYYGASFVYGFGSDNQKIAASFVGVLMLVMMFFISPKIIFKGS